MWRDVLIAKSFLLQVINDPSADTEFFSISLLLCPTNDWPFSPRCHQVPGSFGSFGKMIYIMLPFRYGKTPRPFFPYLPSDAERALERPQPPWSPRQGDAWPSSRAILPTRSLWGCDFLTQVIDIITQDRQ